MTGSSNSLNFPAPGTSGNVPVSNGSKWVSQAPSSGGSYPFVSFTDPTTPSWTWINQGSASVTNIVGAGGNNLIQYVDPSSGSETLKARVIAIPSAPYTATIGFTLNYVIDKNYPSFGLILYDTVSSKNIQFQFGPETSGNKYVNVDEFSDIDTFVSALYTDSNFFPANLMFFQIVDDNTNWHFNYSLDGINFITLYSTSRNTYVTPNMIGFVFTAGGANLSVSGLVFSWAS